jgi:hypothetical protein
VVCRQEVIGGSDLLWVGIGELFDLSVARHCVYILGVRNWGWGIVSVVLRRSLTVEVC